MYLAIQNAHPGGWGPWEASQVNKTLSVETNCKSTFFFRWTPHCHHRNWISNQLKILVEPLTPTHLLVGRRILSLPDHIGYLCDPGDKELTADSVQLTRRLKHLSNTLELMENRILNEAHSHSMGKTHTVEKCSLSVGDVVIVHNAEWLPRCL